MERNISNLGYATITGFDYVLFEGINSTLIDTYGRISVELKTGYAWKAFPFTSGTCQFSEKPDNNQGGKRIKQSFSLTGLKDTYENYEELNDLDRRIYAVRIKYNDGNLIVGERIKGIKFDVERDNSKGRGVKVSFERYWTEKARWEILVNSGSGA